VNTIWGFAANDVYAAGYNSNVHFNGSEWTPVLLGSSGIFDLWGGTIGDLYGVGAKGTITHLTAGVGAKEPSGVATDLYGVWGDTSGTVFAVGVGGTVLRKN
jgi:hypothetical protein